MRIADLSIKNFRGIREGKITFGRHTVLVGPNSSGKTTVIEALTTLFGRDRLVRTLTEHDFFGCDPRPADRIQIVATVVDFAPNTPDDHLDWFRPHRAVPKWYDPASGQLHADKVDESNLLAAQIGFAARFDRENLEVETVRYFHDDDSTTDPFSEEHCVPVPLKLIKELGFFLIPANRAWERMISFDSELFRRVVAQVGGLPADAVREERAKLWKPEHPLEADAKLKSLVEGVNKELAGRFSRKPELRLRLTGTDSDSVLEAITPHFQFADGPPIPSRRQGMGVLSLQSIILLLQLAQHRAAHGKSFCLALEEPELHVPPGLQRRLIHRVHALSTQTIVSTHSPLVASYSEPTNILMLQIDKGRLTASPLSKTGITKSSPNAIRKLLQINRPDTIAALMSECVLVPEGRTEFDLLRLLAMALELHDKELLPERSLFGTLVGIVPTHDAAVLATFEALRSVHPNVVPLIDGDVPGNMYVSNLLGLASPPKMVIRWAAGKTLEHILCWIVSVAPGILPSLGPWLPATPASEADLLDLLSKKSTEGGVKADLVAYEGIVSAVAENQECLNRLSALLSAIASLTSGQSASVPLFQKDAASTATASVFTFRDWLYELKFDGYRMQAVKRNRQVRLFTRTGADYPTRFAKVAQAVAALKPATLHLDGELVAVDRTGKPSFQVLRGGRPLPEGWAIRYYAFDMLRQGQRCFVKTPLTERRAALEELLAGSAVKFSATRPGTADQVVKAVREHGLEGVVAKRVKTFYEAGKRSGPWVKLPCKQSGKFVVGGFRPAGKSFSLLLVGKFDGVRFTFAGKVRHGFDGPSRQRAFDAVKRLRTTACAFDNIPNCKADPFDEGVTPDEDGDVRMGHPCRGDSCRIQRADEAGQSARPRVCQGAPGLTRHSGVSCSSGPGVKGVG